MSSCAHSLPGHGGKSRQSLKNQGIFGLATSEARHLLRERLSIRPSPITVAHAAHHSGLLCERGGLLIRAVSHTTYQIQHDG